MRRSLLALALAASFASLAHAADSRLRYDPEEWVLCRPNALFDFYTPGLGLALERETAPTTLLAREFSLEGQNRFRLEGDVELRRADQRIAAQSIDFDNAAQTWEARTQVHYQDEGMLIRADRAHGNLDAEEAAL